MKKVLIRATWVLGAVAAVLIGSATPASADMLTFVTALGSDSDGPIQATVTFTSIAGGIEVVVTNDVTAAETAGQSGFAKGEAISDFSFTVTGLGTPSAFSELSGNAIDSANFTPGTAFPGVLFYTPFNNFSASPFDSVDHWGFTTSGSAVTLATAGSPVETGSPIYMILPSTGITGPGSSLADGHFDPYILGPGTFFLTDAGVTAATTLTGDIGGVMVGFGTGPDQFLSATPDAPAGVPEPSSIILLGSVTLGMATLLKRKARGRA